MSRDLGISKADKAKEKLQRRGVGKQLWKTSLACRESILQKGEELWEEEESGDKYVLLLLSDHFSGSDSLHFFGK